MGKGLGLTPDDLKKIAKHRYGKDNSKELTKDEANDFIGYLTRLENGEELWPPEEDVTEADDIEVLPDIWHVLPEDMELVT